MAVYDSSYQNIVDGDLSEYDKHERNRDRKRSHSVKLRHGEEEHSLKERNGRKHIAYGMPVQQMAHDQLGK